MCDTTPAVATLTAATSLPPLVIAIDGPSASGKGTLAKALAKALDFVYVDSGAIYRTVALACLRAGREPGETSEVIEFMPLLSMRLDVSGGVLRLDGVAVDDTHIRNGRVEEAAKTIAKIPEVRAFVTYLQRQFAASGVGAVIEGRDIGTVVCPTARLKVYLDASLDARATRRWCERKVQSPGISLAQVREDIERRDAEDAARKHSPLTMAPDAIRIDCTNASADNVFAQVLDLWDALK